MPYIADEARRSELKAGHGATNAGELNFVLTAIIQEYFKNNGGRYQQINDIVGALEGAKLEFTRRITNPYEDGAIARNGDVYD